MSTVDIDTKIEGCDNCGMSAWVCNMLQDLVYDYVPTSEKRELAVKMRDHETAYIKQLRTHLKAELLAKMPKEKSDDWCVGEYKDFGQGFNKAITEITKLVEEL